MRAFILSLLTTLLILPGIRAQPEAPSVHIIHLKNRSAPEMVDLLKTHLTEATYSADARANNLVVRCTKGYLPVIEKLVVRLEAEAERKQEPMTQLSIISLKHRPVDEGLERILHSVMQNPPLLAKDAAHNALIVRGTVEQIKELKILLQLLDAPEQPAAKKEPSENYQIRLVWLRAGETKWKKPLPEDMKKVGEQLTKLGFKDLSLVQQTVINAKSGAGFTSESKSGPGELMAWTSKGTVRVEAGGNKATLSIHIQTKDIGGGELALGKNEVELETEIGLPIDGHTVLLGATPSAEGTHIFAVQVLSK